MSSILDCSPRLDSLSIEVGASADTGLCLYRHTSNRAAAVIPPEIRFREAEVKYVVARDFVTLLGRLVSISVNSARLLYRPLQLALPAGSLASQSRSGNRQDSLGSSFLGPFPVVVDQAIQCSSGEAPSGPSSPAENIHGYLHQRLGILGSQSAAGRWLATKTAWHINELELLAIQKRQSPNSSL